MRARVKGSGPVRATKHAICSDMKQSAKITRAVAGKVSL